MVRLSSPSFGQRPKVISIFLWMASLITISTFNNINLSTWPPDITISVKYIITIEEVQAGRLCLHLNILNSQNIIHLLHLHHHQASLVLLRKKFENHPQFTSIIIIYILIYIPVISRQAIHFISSCLAWLPQDRMSPTQALRQGLDKISVYQRHKLNHQSDRKIVFQFSKKPNQAYIF